MGSAPWPWVPPSFQQQAIQLFVPEDRGALRQAHLLGMWNTCLRKWGRYLVQPIVGGDLVVPDPDIGHVVINVAKPHLCEGGIGWSVV